MICSRDVRNQAFATYWMWIRVTDHRLYKFSSQTSPIGRIPHPNIPVSMPLFRQPLSEKLFDDRPRGRPAQPWHPFHPIQLARPANSMIHSMIIPRWNTINLLIQREYRQRMRNIREEIRRDLEIVFNDNNMLRGRKIIIDRVWKGTTIMLTDAGRLGPFRRTLNRPYSKKAFSSVNISNYFKTLIIVAWCNVILTYLVLKQRRYQRNIHRWRQLNLHYEHREHLKYELVNERGI